MRDWDYLKNLLDNAKVEWLSLGEVATLQRGRPITKNYIESNKGSYPVYSSQTTNAGIIGKINSFDFEGEFVSWTTDGAYAGTCFYRKGKFSVTNVCGLIKINDEHKLNCKFLFYWLSITAKKYVNKGMGNPKLMAHQTKKIPIPLPPIEVQKEIANILDKFDRLTHSITQGLPYEIALRQKQYIYYRDKLLDFAENDKNIKWLPLGEVTKYKQPAKYIIKHPIHKEGKTPVLTAGKTFILGYTPEVKNIYNASLEPTIIFDDFTSANKWVDFDFKVKSSAIKMIISSDTDRFFLKYIYYWLNTFTKQQSQADHRRQWISVFCRKKIPLPPIEVQKEIVNILDTLTSLTSELTSELSARKKQFNYYRALLLNFVR